MPECKLDSDLLTQCDVTLSKCGRPQAPPGLSYVDIPYPLLYNVAVGDEKTVLGTREVSTPAEWRLRAIEVIQSSSAFIRIQDPSGRFLSNYLMDEVPNAWAGSFRKVFTNDLVCQPGQKFRITSDTTQTGAGASNIAILFDGVIRFALRSNLGGTGSMASEQKRYFRSPNGNILAPEMALDLSYSEIPVGYEQSEYRVSTLPNVASILTPGGQVTLGIPLNSRYDWQIRRLTFETAFQAGVTGTVSVIARDTSGFALSTDYVPTDLLHNMPWAHNWVIRGGQTLFFDFDLSLTTGAGAVSISANAICMRTRRMR